MHVVVEDRTGLFSQFSLFSTVPQGMPIAHLP